MYDFLYIHVNTWHRPNFFCDVAGVILGTSPASHYLFHFVSYRVATTASLQFDLILNQKFLEFWIKVKKKIKIKNENSSFFDRFVVFFYNAFSSYLHSPPHQCRSLLLPNPSRSSLSLSLLRIYCMRNEFHFQNFQFHHLFIYFFIS